MSAPRAKKGDIWETLLLLAVFILAAIFIYQLWKLITAANDTIWNAANYVGQALSNTTSMISGLGSSLLNPLNWISAPVTFVESLIGAITGTLSWAAFFSAVENALASIYGPLGILFNDIFGALYSSTPTSAASVPDTGTTLSGYGTNNLGANQ